MMQNNQSISRVTKVVISAAGRSTRMQHLTKKKPKHMIMLNNKPFIFYLVESLKEAGLQDIILVTGYQAKQLEEFARTLSYPINIVNQFEVLGEEEYGTACPLKVVRDIVGNKSFINVAGDNFYQADDIKRVLQCDNPLCIGGKKVKNPEGMGILVTDKNGYIKKIVEKPKVPIGNFVNVSLYKFTPEIFVAIDGIPLSPRGEYDLVDAVNLLARAHRIRVVQLEKFWLDFGRPADIFRFSRFLKSNKK